MLVLVSTIKPGFYPCGFLFYRTYLYLVSYLFAPSSLHFSRTGDGKGGGEEGSRPTFALSSGLRHLRVSRDCHGTAVSHSTCGVYPERA